MLRIFISFNEQCKIHCSRTNHVKFYFDFSYEENFIKILHEAGYTQPDDPCIIQSFDYNSLLHMKNQTMLPCVMLRWIGGPPITDDDLDQYARDGIHCVGSDKVELIEGFFFLNES